MMIKVLIADDQALVRAGFRMIIGSQPDLEVIGEAADGNDAVRLARGRRPDVVLMDIRMPGMDGIAATREIAGPGASGPARVVILTTYDQDEYVFDALAAGACGFLLKDVQPEELVKGIRLAAAGDGLLSPRITRRLIAEFASQYRQPPQPSAATAVLTARERDVLRLVARGQSNTEIAAALTLSENTIKTHVTHILEKLKLPGRIQAVIYAYENGIIEPGKPG